MSESQRLIIDGKPVAFKQGDSVLLASLRADLHPTKGGCLCHAGDCPHCLVTLDGVSYVRACQTRAKAGMVVQRDHLDGTPPLRFDVPAERERHTRFIHCDAVVIGLGESGQTALKQAEAEGKKVLGLDAQQGQEVIGIYAGPLVVVRTEQEMLNVYPKNIIVATGAAEIQAVAQGNHLAGIVTARAASLMHKAGLDLGRVVAVGTLPEGLNATHVEAEIVRFEGKERVTAVVVKDASGLEVRYDCDTVSVGLGFHPRDVLARMANGIENVTSVGDCALEADIPSCPKSGMVCSCSAVSADDLNFSWNLGFHEMELLKRATLAGTGPCQGSVCLPHMRSFLLEKGKTLQDRFTARPVAKQLTLAEVAAGSQLHSVPRTALDEEHRNLGARMDRIGGWWRPWTYGHTREEYWAVREAVSIGDVSTLGKMIVSGPDALAFLEKIYPTQVSSIKTGRSRYVLLLDERGYIMDDGLIAKESDTRYFLTFTSGGSSVAEAWLRDWAATWSMNVRIMNVTMSLAAINVTGPLAKELLKRAGLEYLPAFICHVDAKVAGVNCKVFRLSFTGELSFELHHPAEDAVKLWRALMHLGQDLGIKPHGLEALEQLRLEKGHILVNKDTDFDSSPRRIQHEWMLAKNKIGFIGHHALTRTNKIPLDKQLVGLEIQTDTAPYDGSILYSSKGEYAGYVTSSTYSPVLEKSVMLAWLYFLDGELPSEVTIDGMRAKRVDLPFYDKEASRARA